MPTSRRDRTDLLTVDVARDYTAPSDQELRPNDPAMLLGMSEGLLFTVAAQTGA